MGRWPCAGGKLSRLVAMDRRNRATATTVDNLRRTLAEREAQVRSEARACFVCDVTRRAQIAFLITDLQKLREEESIRGEECAADKVCAV